MSYINIDHNKCTGCGECAASCPFVVLHLEAVDGANKAVIGQGCRLCSTCEMVCEHDAIRFVPDSAPEGSNQSCSVLEAEDFHV